MRDLIKGIFGFFNLEVRKKINHGLLNQNPQMVKGLNRFKKLNLPVNTVIDIGAAAGKWSLAAKEIWTDTSYLLFEPLQERRTELEHLAQKNPNFYFVPKAAGKGKGEIKFVVTEDLDGSGVASSGEVKSNVRSVEVSSIAEEVEKFRLKGPYLVKLDTHGFEVPILEGCEEIIDKISLFIIECYGFRIANNSLLLWEMCDYMDKLGFALFDIVDIMHRQKDGAFWQCDAFFIRKDNPLFKDTSYL